MIRRVVGVGILMYVGVISFQILHHWTDPNWCSPWLRPQVCESDRIQRNIQDRNFPEAKEQLP